MTFPEKINARWIDTLSNEELQQAEGELYVAFTELDSAERSRRGASYDLLHGPEVLTRAWMRWSLVSTAARERGLRMQSRR